MKQFLFFLSIITLILPTSCSSNEEPHISSCRIPLTVTGLEPSDYCESFDYNTNSQVIEWTISTSNQLFQSKYKYYNDNKTVIIETTDFDGVLVREYHETLTVDNNKAFSSKGTFRHYDKDNRLLLEKAYELYFDYDATNHLTSVRHIEYNIDMDGNIISDKPWEWVDYMIWDDSNLVKIEKKQGASYIKQSVQYSYDNTPAGYKLILPGAPTDILHHSPLIMQGFFGENSQKLPSCIDFIQKGINDNAIIYKRKTTYVYLFEDDILTGYIENLDSTNPYYTPTQYRIMWAPK